MVKEHGAPIYDVVESEKAYHDDDSRSRWRWIILDHLVVVHGIRDNDSWANRIATTLKNKRRRTYTYPFNYFSLLSFINPLSRRAAAERMRGALEQKLGDSLGPSDTISFIGHSFGTYLIFEFVRRLHTKYRIGSIAFVSSVLHSFVAPQVIGKCRRFHNFAAVNDWVLLLNNLLPFPSAGLAGRIGCAGYVADRYNGDSFFVTGHSGWFGSRRTGESADWFIGGVLKDFFNGRQVRSEIARPKVEGWVAASLNAYKLVLPSVVAMLVFFGSSAVSESIRGAQLTANTEQARRLTVEAVAALEANQPSEALRLASAAMPNGRSDWPLLDEAFATLLRALSTPRPVEEVLPDELPLYGLERGVAYDELFIHDLARRFRSLRESASGRPIAWLEPLRGTLLPVGVDEDGTVLIATAGDSFVELGRWQAGTYEFAADCDGLDQIWFAIADGERLHGVGVGDGYRDWQSFVVHGDTCSTRTIGQSIAPGPGHIQSYVSWLPGSPRVAIEQEHSWLLFDTQEQRVTCDTAQIVPRLLSVAATAFDWYIAMDSEGNSWRISPDCRRLGDPIVKAGEAAWAVVQNAPWHSRLLVATNSSVFLVRDNGEPVTLVEFDSIDFASFTADRGMVAVVAGATTSLFDAESGMPIAAIPGVISDEFLRTTSGNNVVPDVFVRDGMIVSVDYRRRAKWKLTDRQLPPLPATYHVIFTNSGKLAVAHEFFHTHRAFLLDPSSREAVPSPPHTRSISTLIDPTTESIFATDETGAVYAGRFGDDRYRTIRPGDPASGSSAGLELRFGSANWFVSTIDNRAIVSVDTETLEISSSMALLEDEFVSATSVGDDGILLAVVDGTLRAADHRGKLDLATAPDTTGASFTLLPTGAEGLLLNAGTASRWSVTGGVLWSADLRWSDLAPEAVKHWQAHVRDGIASYAVLTDGSVLIVSYDEDALLDGLRISTSGRLKEVGKLDPGLLWVGLLVTGGGGGDSLKVAKIDDMDRPIEISSDYSVIEVSGDGKSLFVERAGVIYRLDIATKVPTGAAGCSCESGPPLQFSFDGRLLYDDTLGLREFFPPDTTLIEELARSELR